MREVDQVARQKVEDKNIAEGKDHVNVTKVLNVCRHKVAQQALLRQLLRYVLFLTLYCVVVLLQRDAVSSNRMSSSILNEAFNKPFVDTATNEMKTWADVATFEDWWNWHDAVFLDFFYVDNYANGQERPAQEKQTSAQHIRLIQGFRLTQRRVRSDSCWAKLDRFEAFFDHCFGPTFANGLWGFTDKTPFVGAASGKSYEFQELEAPFPVEEEGYYEFFGGVGEKEVSREKLRELRADLWLNAGTSFVRTDFVAYNPNVGHLAQVEFILNVLPSGLMEPKTFIQTVRFREYRATQDYVRMGLEVVFVIAFLLYLGREVWDSVQLARMSRTAWACTRDWWSLFDWLQCVCLAAVIGLRLYIIFNPAVNSLHADQDGIYTETGNNIDLTGIAKFVAAYFTLSGLIFGLSAAKMMKFLRVNIQISILTQTFAEMRRPLLQFFCILMIIIFIWASIGLVLFGPTLATFSGLASAFETTWLLFLQVEGRDAIFDNLPHNEYKNGPFEAYLFYYPFILVMVFVVLNVTVAIIMDAYARVDAHFDYLRQSSDINVLVDRKLHQQIMHAMGMWWLRASSLVLSSSRTKLVQRLTTEHVLVLFASVEAEIVNNQYSTAARIDFIQAQPESGFHELYVAPGGKEKAHPLVIPTSRALHMLADEGIPSDVIVAELDKIDAFCPAEEDEGEVEEGEEKRRQMMDMVQVAAVLKVRAQQVLDDMCRATLKLDRLLASVAPAPAPRAVPPISS